MKTLLFTIFISLSIAASAQSKSVKIYDQYDQLAADIMNHNDDYTYVINYWATWCAPCVAELPYFEQLLSKYKSDKIKVVLVSLDFPRKIDSKLRPFIEQNNIKADVVLLDDPKSNVWIDKVDPSWGGAIPVTIIYKGDKSKFWGESFETYEELEELFLRIHSHN